VKLIDAEVRVTVQSYDIEHEEYEHIEMSVSDALDFATDEGCPPTIDAIPVEWLQERKNWAAIDGDYWSENIIGKLLEAWQKEQEAQDGKA